MPRVFIPPLVRNLTDGQESIDVEAARVRDVVEILEERFPGVRDRLMQDDELRPGLSVSVDGRISSLGLFQTLRPDSEVHFIPAIGGG